jgi:hypothetical protein
MPSQLHDATLRFCFAATHSVRLITVNNDRKYLELITGLSSSASEKCVTAE